MAATYPKAVRLKEDRSATLRRLAPGDEERVAAFIRALSPHDLLFLREDLARPANLRRWTADSSDTAVTALVAELDAEVVGLVSLHRNRPAWSRHVAEIQVIVGPGARRLGLGTLLTQEIFALAIGAGVEKILAEMTHDQTDARSLFEHLGFRVEGLLTRYARDHSGDYRDILILAHDVQTFLQRLDAFGVPDTLGRP